MQIIPEGVTQMIESVNQELRKPSASLKEQERTGDPDSLRRAVSRRRTKHSKLTPIDTKS
jgi:hypothetical protein